MSRARDIADSAATINALDGVTATGAELNILDGVTATTAELNYVDGVTSAIQTQIDAKATYPSQTGNSGKFLTTDGSAASWATVASLGSDAAETIASTTLTASSAAAHLVTASGYGKAITLPDATTLTEGVTVFWLKNVSNVDIAVKNNSGKYVNWLYPGMPIVCTLIDNSTSDGKWEMSDYNLTGYITLKDFSQSNTTNYSRAAPIKLSANKWLVYYYVQNDGYAAVYDESTNTWGALTNVWTSVVAQNLGSCIIDDDRVLITYNAYSNVYAKVLSISGTTITANTEASATIGSFSAVSGETRTLKIGNNYVMVIGTTTTSYVVKPLSVSSTTVTFGSHVAISSVKTYQVPYPINTTSTLSDSFVVFAQDTASGNRFRVTLWTVSGTTLTAEDTVTTSIYGNQQGWACPQLTTNGNIFFTRKDSSQTNVGIIKIDSSTSSLSVSETTGFLPEEINAPMGWLMDGNKLLVYGAANNYIFANVATDSSGTVSKGTSFVKTSNDEGILIGQTSTALYAQNDGQSTQWNAIEKITIDGSNPSAEFLYQYYTSGDASFYQFGPHGQQDRTNSNVYVGPGLYDSGYYYGDLTANKHFKGFGQMESARYFPQFSTQNYGDRSAYFDAENECLVSGNSLHQLPFERNYLNFNSADLSIGWDIKTFQYLDSPNTYKVRFGLRKLCDA